MNGAALLLFSDSRGRSRAPRTDSERRIAAAQAEARAALAANWCPKCGRPVRQNLALTGWVQCSQYGAVGFRADASAPAFKPPAEVWRANLRAKGSRDTPAWASDESGTIEEKAARGHYHLRLPIIDEYRRFGTIAVTVSASCTSNHKVGPIRRCMDDLAVERFGLDNRRWAHQVRKGLRPKHRVLIGIAADEAERAIDTGRPIYERPVYPLVDMGIAKDDEAEAEVLERHGFGDVYKSGCIMCPYQGAGWFWVLRETEPERWAEVLAYETRALEKNPKLGGIVGGVPVAEAVERWRARNPSAGVEEVLSKSYSRCRTSKAQLPLFDLMARSA